MKTFVKIIATCIFFCLIIGILVASLLRLDFMSNQQAYLYRLLSMTGITCIIMMILYIKIPSKIFGLNQIIIQLNIVISGLFMALFFSLGPMVIERSYTVYSLAYIADHEGLYTYQDIRNQFVKGYVDGGATQKRIDEQVSIGNLEKDGDAYRITEKGKSLICLFRMIEKVFPVPDTSSIYPSEIKK